jgi:hypothetical protein
MFDMSADATGWVITAALAIVFLGIVAGMARAAALRLANA